jgi:hypothetical protein
MSAGFPDDEGIFAPFAIKLSKELDAFVGVTCLPGYHDEGDNQSWKRYKKNGYTFDEMTNAFREASKALRQEYLTTANSKDDVKKVHMIGIFHDWGVIPGLMWANRASQDLLSSASWSKQSSKNTSMMIFILQFHCQSQHQHFHYHLIIISGYIASRWIGAF